MRKMKCWILKSQNDISRELTMTVSWSLFLKKIQTYSCGKIRSSLEALSNLTGIGNDKDNYDIFFSGYTIENGFVSKLFSMMNVDIDSQTITKSTNR